MPCRKAHLRSVSVSLYAREHEDPGNAVSGVPGTAAHIQIHNPSVFSHNFNERDVGTATLQHRITSPEGPEETTPMRHPEPAE